MMIVKTIQQYNDDNVYFSESIKNNIINNGNFIRIIYSNELFSLNGIYLHIPLKSERIEPYFNKYRYTFDIKSHIEIIEEIKNIENSLLDKYNVPYKKKHFKVYEQFLNGYIKIFIDNFDNINNSIILKISGLWETNLCYGLTYKFIPINN